MSAQTARSVVAFIFAVIFFVTTLFAFLYSVYGLTAEQASLRTAVSAARFETDRASKTGSVQKLLRGSAASVEQLQKYFVSSDNIVPFVENIETLGKSVSPSQLSLSSIALAPSHDSLSAHLAISGSFAEVYRMLGLIELLPFKVKIGDVQLSYGGASQTDAFDLKHTGVPVIPRWSGNVLVTIESVLPISR